MATGHAAAAPPTRKSRVVAASMLRYLAIPLACFLAGQWMLFDLQRSTVYGSSNEHQLPEDLKKGFRNKPSGGRRRAETTTNHELILDSNSTALERIQPILLSPEGRSKQHLFVHIGKAGGSSIQVMVKKSRQMCQKLTELGRRDPEQRLEKAQTCALATIPDGRVHLKDRLHPEKFYSKYTQFLVNLRDPIDRLVSWYNYEVASFRKEPRWSSANKTGEASDNFRRLTRECFPGTAEEDGFARMVRGGLLSAPPVNDGERARDGGAVESCDQLARLCLRGDILCFGHNYYNYEVYLEEILRRKGMSVPNHGNHRERIRIDVIRSEHSMQDFNKTVGLWTSRSVREWESFPGVTPYVQSLYGRVRSIEAYDEKRKKTKPKKKPEVLAPGERAALCRHICTELVVYKLALRAAENLYASDVRESYEALDDHCGFVVDEVCGTTWSFRDIKAQKKVFDAPW